MAKYIVCTGGLMGFLFATMMLLGSGTPPYLKENQPGYQSAMLWFELTQNLQEIPLILGPPGSPQDLRKIMDRVNYVDFFFMIAYSLFNALLFFYFASKKENVEKKKKILYSGLFLCILMWMGDGVENLQLLKLSDPGLSFSSPVARDSLVLLIVFTRIKWLSLFLASFLHALSFYRIKDQKWKYLLALSYLVASWMGMLGLVHERGFEIEGAMVFLAGAWTLSVIFFTLEWKKEKEIVNGSIEK